jgi:protein arginine N-methyltransferase 1
MIVHRERTDALAEALRRRITPDSVVVDVGTGPGILALLACQYGARKVYAIEIEDVIQVARECAEIAGYADRIEFIQGDSSKITLPERVHGIASDIRGNLPVFGSSLCVMRDARERFLLPGGWIIPTRDTLWAAAVSCATDFDTNLGIWINNPYGFDMTPARRRVLNTPRRIRSRGEDLVTAPARWAVVDYETLSDPNVEGQARMEVHTAREAHGLCVWFDCETAEGLGFSRSPATPEADIFGQVFFPWPECVTMCEGDVVSVSLKATLVGPDYVWQWNSMIRSADGQAKADFHQNNLMGSAISAQQLRRRAHSHVPRLSSEGEVTFEILQRMQEGARLEEIAREIAARHPEPYPRWEDALSRVADMSEKYGL